MWLDNLVGWFSPKAGLERHLARSSLKQVRSFEAAKKTRRTAGWNATGGSANTEAISGLVNLRNRSRDLVMNNSYAASWLDKRVTNAIGTGIVCKFAKDKAAQKAWADWIKVCDADGQLDFNGLQALGARCMDESGEVLLRFRNRRPEDGLAVPLQVQIMEPDFLDHEKTEDLKGGGYIIGGVEFDAIGKLQAYWLFDRHPGEVGRLFRGFKSKRVVADDVRLIFEKKRPGQVRGTPKLAPVLLRLRDLDDYEDAELMRKKIEACFAAFVTRDSDFEGDPVTGQPRQKLSPGMIERLKPGESVEFGSPAATGGYAEFTRAHLRAAASGSGVTYEMLTGDLSQVNYSSARIGMLEFRAGIEQFRWLTFIPQLLDPIVERWKLTAKLAGVIKKTDTPHEWTCPKWNWVDPVKDVTGELLEIASGLKTWGEGVKQRGYDPDEQLEAIKAERDKIKAAELALDFKGVQIGQIETQPNPAESGV